MKILYLSQAAASKSQGMFQVQVIHKALPQMSGCLGLPPWGTPIHHLFQDKPFILGTPIYGTPICFVFCFG